jgi:proline iminopeptidase
MILAMLKTYYPSIEPYAKHRLAVESPHELYIEEVGNPQGVPILIVHGGPGTGFSDNSRCLCDPNIYRIILFDQRGAGKSTPLGELQNNNTQALVKDIEIIREYLHIEQWMLLGGSWGSTLALVYSQTYPEKILGLILRGIFLARHKDIEWVYGDIGANRVFPDHWQDFVSLVPDMHHHDPVPFYFDLLNSSDNNQQIIAAKTWATWEGRMLRLVEDKKADEQFINSPTILGFSRISCYYMLNNCFLEPNQILRNMKKIAHIPVIMIHGRYDLVCLVENAWDLHNAWQKSELNIVHAGHSASETEILDCIIRATERMFQLIKI